MGSKARCRERPWRGPINGIPGCVDTIKAQGGGIARSTTLTPGYDAVPGGQINHRRI